MVGAKRKKVKSSAMPQFKIGGVYHSSMFTDGGRKGHFVIIAKILDPEHVRVHVCTSSERCASGGSINAYGLLGGEETYILTRPEVVHPSRIGQSRHITIDNALAARLGIELQEK